MVRPVPLSLIAFLLLLPFSPAGAAQPDQNPEAIRRELKSLRQGTDWSNPVSVQRMKLRTQELMKKLQKLQHERDAAESRAAGEANPAEEGKEIVNSRERLWEKVREAGLAGPGSFADLAEPVRQKVIDEYIEDRDYSIKNAAIYQELTLLLIDFSRPGAQALVETMDKFRGIKTLVLTGGKSGAPVNLSEVLQKAQAMPLEELYIINFRGFVGSLPSALGNFSGLTRLSLFNNSIESLPESVANLKGLKLLQVDLNPIATVLATVKQLPFLTEIGIGKTQVPAAEQELLARMLPNCRIALQ